jgi:hypothetical protein
MPARSWSLIALIAALAIAGCGAEGTPVGTSVPVATTATSASQDVDLPHLILDPPPPTACLTLDPGNCARAMDIAAGSLDPQDPAVVYAQVGPFDCATGERCAADLTARPQGDVVFEFAGGTGLNVHVTLAPDGSVGADREAAPGVSVAPTSSPVTGPGPFAFALGHCGIFSGIDLDGSWWDPVGNVPLESGEAVNATAGSVVLSDPTHGVFSTPAGFTIQLQRHAGSRLLPFCM